MSTSPVPTSSPARCDCAEAYVEGRYIRVAGHSCAYIKARNALIPAAEDRATLIVPDRKRASWSYEFVVAMQELAYERGLVAPPASYVQRFGGHLRSVA